MMEIEMADKAVQMINDYGFPTVAALGLGYFIYYVWNWVVKDIKPVTSESAQVLDALENRIRTLDNDLIRLHQKLNTVLQLRDPRKYQETKARKAPRGKTKQG